MSIHHHPGNERIKREYFAFLKEAKGRSESTVDAAASAIASYESFTEWADFRTYSPEQAVQFKKSILDRVHPVTAEPISRSTAYTTFGLVKRFIEWLSVQPAYRSKIKHSDAAYLNSSSSDARIATARRELIGPEMSQILEIVRVMPHVTDVDKRNRALIAFTALTGARDAAIRTFKLKHYDEDRRCIFQDAREVATKLAKSFTTFIFPVDKTLYEIFVDWVKFLRNVRDWGDDDPLFPATKSHQEADLCFGAGRLERRHWANARPICDIFRRACRKAGLQYFNPHSFRNTLTRYGMSICQTPEEFKAWSQNFGHEHVMTTLNSYGTVSERRQGEILEKLGESKSDPKLEAAIRTLIDAARR